MVIGVVREIMHGEGRVAATPETVGMYIRDGFSVLVERLAGEGSLFSDAQYLSAGAEIVDGAREVYRRADVILKVKEPLFNEAAGMHEIDMMHPGQVLIAFIHPASPVNHGMVRRMAEKGVVGLTLDGIPRITRAQRMDALTSMSTCAGYKGMLIAANDLTKFVPQIFCAVGAIKPCNALIVGAGVAGLQAIATAKRLGAVVHAADIRPDAAEQAKSLGAKIVDTGVPRETAVGEGGYANSLSADWLMKEREALASAIPEMDIVFLSALVPSKLAPILVTKDMVKLMKPGSVIIDISVDQGGNCEMTVPGETAVAEGVVIKGIKNIPGMLPTSATWMFANNVCHLVRYLSKGAELSLDMDDEIVKGILTTVGGNVVHRGALEAMGGA
ncbi:MAG: NAD(P) transhydrogenase subunit alpha [Clostridiales bacterium]|nr:NAD(P) transhydrogenase subunit alpha [Clostridiales bacterium]